MVSRNPFALVAMLAAVGLLAGSCYARRLYVTGRDDPGRYEAKFEAIDRRFAAHPPTGGVVLTGSSYIEMWKSSEQDLAPLLSVNIGVGGTRAGDHLVHLDRMLPRFQPAAVVVYVGSNDINGSRFFSKTAGRTVPLVLRYLDAIHHALPNARLYYIAITEAPVRANVRDEIRTANLALSAAATATGRFTFIDTSTALLTADGAIDESLFGEDRLHLNKRGYEVFAAAVRAGLQPEFERFAPGR